MVIAFLGLKNYKGDGGLEEIVFCMAGMAFIHAASHHSPRPTAPNGGNRHPKATNGIPYALVRPHIKCKLTAVGLCKSHNDTSLNLLQEAISCSGNGPGGGFGCSKLAAERDQNGTTWPPLAMDLWSKIPPTLSPSGPVRKWRDTSVSSVTRSSTR